MKIFTITLFTLFLSSQMIAQNDTTSTTISSGIDTSSSTISSKEEPYKSNSIFGSGELVGGFGALSIKGSRVDDTDVLLMGVKGGFVLGHNLNIGLAGYGFVTQMNLQDKGFLKYGGGYGGLYFEPVIWSDKVVHLAFPVIIGGGGMGSYINYSGNDPYEDIYVQDVSGFFVFEPGAMVEINIIKNIRLDLGGTYRLTYGLDLPNVSNDVLNNWTVECTLKIGAF